VQGRRIEESEETHRFFIEKKTNRLDNGFQMESVKQPEHGMGEKTAL
jgi:hypothetical protein